VERRLRFLVALDQGVQMVVELHHDRKTPPPASLLGYNSSRRTRT
jgi:hypothetical protein